MKLRSGPIEDIVAELELLLDERRLSGLRPLIAIPYRFAAVLSPHVAAVAQCYPVTVSWGVGGNQA